MKYTYNDMPDKSIEGVRKELNDGLVKIAVFFTQSLGIPFENFKDMLKDNCKNDAEAMLFYMNFRNLHPKIFDK
jgi:hypothetical protein